MYNVKMLKRFREWMNYNPPYALSWDEWADFDLEFRKNAPVRHFLVKRFYRWYRVHVVMRAEHMLDWIRYRTTRRYHIIDTGLAPGYYDKDTLLLHTNFKLLVDYVEVELAWMNIVFEKEEFKKYYGWRRFLPRFLRTEFRNKELGLRHLEWEMTLDDPNLPETERSDSQAEKARIVKDLYIWWTEERPKRTDEPYPEVQTDDFMPSLSQRWKAEHPEQAKLISDWARASNDQEEQWAAEDTAHLIELMLIRRGLWT